MEQIAKRVSVALFPSLVLTVRTRGLFVCDVGSELKLDCNASVADRAFCSLLVQLPSQGHSAMTVRHGDDATYDFGAASGLAPFVSHFMAAYLSADTTIAPVAGGVRVVLAVDFVWTLEGPPPSVRQPRTLHVPVLAEALRAWDFSDGRKLIFFVTPDSVGEDIAGHLTPRDRAVVAGVQDAAQLLPPAQRLAMHFVTARATQGTRLRVWNEPGPSGTHAHIPRDRWDAAGPVTETLAGWQDAAGHAWPLGKFVRLNVARDAVQAPWVAAAEAGHDGRYHVGTLHYVRRCAVLWPAAGEQAMLLHDGGAAAGAAVLKAVLRPALPAADGPVPMEVDGDTQAPDDSMVAAAPLPALAPDARAAVAAAVDIMLREFAAMAARSGLGSGTARSLLRLMAAAAVALDDAAIARRLLAGPVMAVGIMRASVSTRVVGVLVQHFGMAAVQDAVLALLTPAADPAAAVALLQVVAANLAPHTDTDDTIAVMLACVTRVLPVVRGSDDATVRALVPLCCTGPTASLPLARDLLAALAARGGLASAGAGHALTAAGARFGWPAIADVAVQLFAGLTAAQAGVGVDVLDAMVAAQAADGTLCAEDRHTSQRVFFLHVLTLAGATPALLVRLADIAVATGDAELAEPWMAAAGAAQAVPQPVAEAAVRVLQKFSTNVLVSTVSKVCQRAAGAAAGSTALGFLLLHLIQDFHATLGDRLMTLVAANLTALHTQSRAEFTRVLDALVDGGHADATLGVVLRPADVAVGAVMQDAVRVLGQRLGTAAIATALVARLDAVAISARDTFHALLPMLWRDLPDAAAPVAASLAARAVTATATKPVALAGDTLFTLLQDVFLPIRTTHEALLTAFVANIAANAPAAAVAKLVTMMVGAVMPASLSIPPLATLVQRRQTDIVSELAAVPAVTAPRPITDARFGPQVTRFLQGSEHSIFLQGFRNIVDARATAASIGRQTSLLTLAPSGAGASARIMVTRSPQAVEDGKNLARAAALRDEITRLRNLGTGTARGTKRTSS